MRVIKGVLMCLIFECCDRLCAIFKYSILNVLICQTLYFTFQYGWNNFFPGNGM